LQSSGPVRKLRLRPRQHGLRSRTFRPAVEALEGRALLSGGALDPTFGQGNPVLIDFGGQDFGRRLALQPDGKIIALGLSTSADGATRSYALARQNPDGTPDATFGTNGQVVTPFGNPGNLTLQADGKIVVAGGSSTGFGLARYNPDGTP